MGTPALVGRDEEVRRLRRVLDEATAGIGRLLLISGEPGVGKTRLALELVGDAERLGALTAVGACWDGAGAPGLWPWIQVLRTIREASTSTMIAGTGALDQLLDLGQPAAPSDFHLFEAALQLFTEVCRQRPVVVLLDDLQWADATSIALADFLHRHAVHLPLLVLGTYRPDELARAAAAGAGALGDLAQKAIAVPLTGLDNDAIRALRGDLGAPTTTAEAEHLRRLTGGNPFFVIESIAFSDPAESLGVRRAVERRIDSLAPLEQEVLTVAALIGRDVAVPVLVAVLDDEGATRDAIASVERSGLISLDGEQLAFVHDLVREAMRVRIAPDEARARRAYVVNAVESSRLERHLLPAQLAWLAKEAVPDLPATRAVALLEAAAADASARLTYDAAGQHLEDAAALADDDELRARLTLESANAFQRAGALARARAGYLSLADLPSVETRARALLGLHRVGDQAATDAPSDVVRRIDALDDELDDTSDLALRAEVRAARSRARSHLLADDRTAAAPMAAEALDLARRSDDAATVATCLVAYHDAIWQPGTEVERRGVADELIETGRRLGDPVVDGQGLLLRMVAELELGDPQWCLTHERFDSLAARSGLPRLQFVASSRRGMVAALHGDMGAARDEIDAARALGERIGDPDAVGMWCDQRWQVARHTGDDDAIDDLMRTLRDGGDPHWMVYAALVAVRENDLDAAMRLLPEVTVLGERWPRWAARLWDAFLVELAALERDEHRLTSLVARLEPDAQRWAVLGGGVLVHGPMALWLGRLEAAREDWSSARGRATVAEDAARRLDSLLWVLEARADRLVAEHALGAADPNEVEATIDHALALGLHPLVARLTAIRSSTPSSLAPNTFRRDHDVWTIVFDGVDVRLPDAKGLRDLHVLLQHPNVDVAATSLATDAPVSSAAVAVLDAEAKAEYRRRLDDIDRELDHADRRGDVDRGRKLEAEREALLHELRAAAGLGGRDRRLGDDRERLRKTVTARIRDTLRRLDDRHPALAAHLRASIRTGAMCAYSPAQPVRWEL